MDDTVELGNTTIYGSLVRMLRAVISGFSNRKKPNERQDTVHEVVNILGYEYVANRDEYHTT